MKLASADSKKLPTVRSSRQREDRDSGKQSVEISPLEVIRAMRTLEQQPQDDLSSFSQLPQHMTPNRRLSALLRLEASCTTYLDIVQPYQPGLVG